MWAAQLVSSYGPARVDRPTGPHAWAVRLGRYAWRVSENSGAKRAEGTGEQSNDALSPVESFKRQAALKALALVESGMVLGLGTGSTAKWLVVELGAKLASGQLADIVAVPTSKQTQEQAEQLGIPLTELPADGVDLCIDGMDEVGPGLDAIKGLGGALTREKIVAVSATHFVLIGDDTKYVTHLGQKTPVPVEVVTFGSARTVRALSYLGATPKQRMNGERPYITDNSNFIYDCHFDGEFDTQTVALAMAEIPGVVEHGLFLGVADVAFVASATGVVQLGRDWRG